MIKTLIIPLIIFALLLVWAHKVDKSLIKTGKYVYNKRGLIQSFIKVFE